MIKLQLQPDQKMLSQFAWVAPIGFLAFAWLFSRFGLGDTAFWVTLSLGPITLVSHLAGLRVVPLTMFRALVLLTFPIGLVVLPLLIGAIYYGVFTPMGLVFRLIGRDVMGRKFDRGTATYWRDRGAPRAASSYFKLY